VSENLPSSWTWASLGELLAEPLRNGRSVPDNAAGFPVLRLTAIRKTRIQLDEFKLGEWTEDQAEPYLVRKDDFLVARGNGSLDLVGRGGLVGDVPQVVAFPDTMIRVRPRTVAIAPEYLRHLWNSPVIRRQIEQSARTTAGIYKINQEHLRQTQIPLPPRQEQDRIAETLDVQVSRFETAVADLHRVRANLKRYRAAVLKAACEGRLVPTEAELARREGRGFEPAHVPLDRILKERRAKWEEQELARIKRNGKAPKDDRWKRKYKAPEAPDTVGLPELPEGWVWATVDQLASPEPYAITDGPFGSNLKTAHYTERGPRVVRLQNIGDGVFVDEKAHISVEHYQTLKKHAVYARDLVIASLGSELPRSCLIPATLGPAIVKADCIRFKPAERIVLAEYANIVLTADPTRKRMSPNIHGMGRPRLGLRTVRTIPVPLPPLSEQVRIVAEVDKLLSVGEATAAVLDLTLARGTRFHQSILKRAFEGRLVAHDPNDEPASALLERMRAERKAGETSVGAGR
jgi:type I restriction enzyme, S subunit